MLNVNIPNLPGGQIKGVRVTAQAESHYHEKIECRHDPRGRDYYWIWGTNKVVGDPDGTDMDAVASGYISITPIHARLTNEQLLPEIRSWHLE
jgi:5'-nucleotidase